VILLGGKSAMSFSSIKLRKGSGKKSTSQGGPKGRRRKASKTENQACLILRRKERTDPSAPGRQNREKCEFHDQAGRSKDPPPEKRGKKKQGHVVKEKTPCLALQSRRGGTEEKHHLHRWDAKTNRFVKKKDLF